MESAAASAISQQGQKSPCWAGRWRANAERTTNEQVNTPPDKVILHKAQFVFLLGLLRNHAPQIVDLGL